LSRAKFQEKRVNHAVGSDDVTMDFLSLKRISELSKTENSKTLNGLLNVELFYEEAISIYS